MANKKIIVSSGDGKYQQISASVDNNQISASYLCINTGSFSVLGNGLLQNVNGKVENLTGSANNHKLAYDPDMGKFTSVASVTASLGGDLSGLSSAARVKSIANVTSGILSAANGGTGTSSFGVDNLVTTNGDGLSYSQTNSNKIVAVGQDGNIVFTDPAILNFTPMTGTLIYLYTGSLGATQTFNWTKPEGCRFIRVICQSGGGGGAGGTNGTSTQRSHGRGGTGGGCSDVIISGFSVDNTVLVTVGAGGSGGWVGGGGGRGINSSFGDHVKSVGGYGGNPGYSGVAQQYCGYGYKYIGGLADIESTKLFSAPGGSGGNGLSKGITGILSSATVLGTMTSISPFNYTNYYLNNTLITNQPFPNIICSGGAGAIAANSPGYKPRFGAGGGGGFVGGSSSGASAGGAGGDGYVVIMCW